MSFISYSAARFPNHLSDNELYEQMQSAYRPHHSIETALVKVCNDLSCSLHERKAVILVLLDMSAAFDTIDNGIMLSRLKDRFRISGTVLHSSNPTWKTVLRTFRCTTRYRRNKLWLLESHKDRCWARCSSHIQHLFVVLHVATESPLIYTPMIPNSTSSSAHYQMTHDFISLRQSFIYVLYSFIFIMYYYNNLLIFSLYLYKHVNNFFF